MSRFLQFQQCGMGGLILVLATMAFSTEGFAQTPKFVYVSNSGDNNISGYSMDATTGALTVVAGSSMTGFHHSTTPRHVLPPQRLRNFSSSGSR